MTDIDIPEPLARLARAINDGDEDAFVAAFTPEGRVDDWGRVLEGHDGVRSWAQTDAIGQQARIDIRSAETEGDVTTIEFDWRSNRFNGTSTAFVTVAGDKVAEFRIPPH